MPPKKVPESVIKGIKNKEALVSWMLENIDHSLILQCLQPSAVTEAASTPFRRSHLLVPPALLVHPVLLAIPPVSLVHLYLPKPVHLVLPVLPVLPHLRCPRSGITGCYTGGCRGDAYQHNFK